MSSILIGAQQDKDGDIWAGYAHAYLKCIAYDNSPSDVRIYIGSLYTVIMWKNVYTPMAVLLVNQLHLPLQVKV